MRRVRRLLVLLLLVGGLALAPQQASAGLSPSQVEAEQAIAWAAGYWGVSGVWMERVAWCESGLWPTAYNPQSGTVGLYQFLPSTYYWLAGRIGETRSYWNPWASANVAAWAFAHGYARLWACA